MNMSAAFDTVTVSTGRYEPGKTIVINLDEYQNLKVIKNRMRNLASVGNRLISVISAEDNVLTDNTVDAIAIFRNALDILTGKIEL